MCESSTLVARAMILVVLFGLFTSSANANLLINGGGESGTMTPWLTDAGECVETRTEAAGVVTPYEGGWLFSLAKHPASLGFMQQSGTSGLGSPYLRLSGMFQSEYGDEAVVYLAILDGEGQVLSYTLVDELVSDTLVWEPFEALVDVPSGAATWEVELRGVRHYGSYINTFFDVVDLTGMTYSPGDADFDGDVDLDDFVILKSNFSSGSSWGEGDFDGDGDVDLDDFVILKSNFATAAIPEPATLTLLGVAAVGVLRRRRAG